MSDADNTVQCPNCKSEIPTGGLEVRIGYDSSGHITGMTIGPVKCPQCGHRFSVEPVKAGSTPAPASSEARPHPPRPWWKFWA